MEKKVKILLTGSEGNLGFSIKDKLKNFKNIILANKKKLNFNNLNSINNFLNKNKPDIIINTAAYTNVDGAEKNKNICYKVNALAPKKIADWSYKNNSYFIHFSTDYVFDGKKKTPWNEKDKPKPLNFYGKSKYDGEKFIINSKCKFILLRVAWLYSDRKNNFHQKIIKKLLEEDKIYVIKDQIGTPNHVEFISEITIKVLKKIIKNFDIKSNIFHVSLKGQTSYYNWAKKIKIKLKNNNCKILPVSHKKFKTIAKRPLNSVFSCNSLEKFLKIKIPNWEKVFKKKANIIIKNSN